MQRTNRWAALGLICLLPIVLYLPFLTEPFQNDEGLYAYVGRLLLHGGLPYRDAFDNKPPAVFAWYALSFLLFGEHVWAPRLLVALLLSVTTLLVYVEGKLVWSVRAGLVAALAFALSMGIARLDSNANTEYFLVLPMTAGLVTYTMARRRGGGWYLLAGALNGLAVVTKETALFPFAFLIVFHARSYSRVTVRKATGEVLLLVAGAVFVGILALLPFVISGTFDDFWSAGVVYTLRYVSDGSAVGRVFGAVSRTLLLTFFAGPWVGLSILAVLRARKNAQSGEHWLIAGWLIASYAGIIVVGRFFPHYFVQMLPGMALLVPAGLVYLRDMWRQSNRVYLAWVAVLVFCAGSALFFSADVYGRASPEAPHIAKHPDNELTLFEVDSPRLGEFIRQNTTDDDRIYNLGFQTELYFYADRESPTKFILDRPFVTDSDYVVQAERELRADPPKYIIDSARNDPWEPGKYDASGLRAFITERYEYVGKIYYADVYRLRE